MLALFAAVLIQATNGVPFAAALDQVAAERARDQKADIVLPDDTVSRIHARIELRTDGFYVNDLYSTNGTWLNGRRIEPGNAVRLSDGAALGMGSLQFRVQL